MMVTRFPKLRSFLPAIATLLLLPAPSHAATTHIEHDDPSVTYSGNWYANSSAAHSGGLAALTNTGGARATITFTGTGISWVGVTDGWSGLANVYLDGTMSVVDTYAGMTGYQRVLYTVRGLTAGPHTLSIEVTHERGPHTQGSWVWIDAFDIEDGAGVPGGISASTGLVEESHPALVFTGRWYRNTSAVHSAGSAVLAMDAKSRASINFNGTGIAWLAYRDEWSGIARVYVDGELRTEIDNYLAPARARTVPFRIGDLAAGAHTLTIEATGTRNASSKGSWVWIDAFEVIP